MIHRDLKPANLMIVDAGTPHEHLKVMDFGLAQLTSKPLLAKAKFSGSTDIMAQGTPAYIPPEQLRGDPVDGRADLYSAGVILFETIVGRLPFPEDDIDVLADAHLHRSPPTFAALGMCDVPAAFENVVHRCLAKFAAERPISASALAADLGQALGIDLWAETAPVAEIRRETPAPPAGDVAMEPVSGPNAIVRRTEAWMPDSIAIVKLGGFLSDAGGRLISTQPGLLKRAFRASTSSRRLSLNAWPARFKSPAMASIWT